MSEDAGPCVGGRGHDVAWSPEHSRLDCSRCGAVFGAIDEVRREALKEAAAKALEAMMMLPAEHEARAALFSVVRAILAKGDLPMPDAPAP